MNLNVVANMAKTLEKFSNMITAGMDVAQAIPDRAGERIVVAGFYNFSNNFQNRNNRNTQIIYNPELAALYSR